ncbi:synaptosomal-associated protein 29-like, partial [Limulus polyphemus]|uniref:Synaptosomal-associated protein 29-like n=1 Tax=Limulus polyphemus TaxID=6850 RepID=A0ABM1TFP7_LIMPO
MVEMSTPNYNAGFDDDNEDMDDFLFLNHPKQGSSGYMLGNERNSEDNVLRLRQQELLEEQRKIQERTLQSTQSSLGLIHENEQIGIATAEELDRQGTQLHNVEKKVDDINRVMRVSHQHITSMKSFFGSIKNYFRGSTETQVALDEPEDKKPTVLMSTVGKIREDHAASSSSSHPGLRMRGLEASGFSESVDDTKFTGTTSVIQKSADTAYSTRSQMYEENFNRNL